MKRFIAVCFIGAAFCYTMALQGCATAQGRTGQPMETVDPVVKDQPVAREWTPIPGRVVVDKERVVYQQWVQRKAGQDAEQGDPLRWVKMGQLGEILDGNETKPAGGGE